MVIRDIIFSITPPALHNVLWIKAGDNDINDLYVYNGGWRKIGTSSGGTSDYNDLENKPRIDNVVLEGNLTLQELGIILPDLSECVTEEALSKTLETYAKKSDIPDTSNLVTESELSSAISEQEFKTINGQEITGEGNIEISGEGSITIDDELNKTSTNPVQNKVITEELESISGQLTELSTKVLPTTFGTLNEMKTSDEASLSPGHISFCEEDRNTYKYDPNNSADAVTGKWRLFGGGLNYHEIPELTEDYMVTSNPSLTNEEVYYIKIGATVHAVIGDSTVKWQDGKSPVSEANSTIVVSVLNNLAVWGIFK